MKNNIKIRQIIDENDPALDQVAVLFAELYDYVKDKGQKNQMIEGGEKLWINSVRKSLNKLGAIFVAEEDATVVGFIHGTIRFLPDFLGGKKTGFIAHHYINNKHRGLKLGKRLLEETEKWFVSRGVFQSESYVNVGNINSKVYFERNGYTHEIVQLRKFLEENQKNLD